MIVAPAADCFPTHPVSWYYFCRSRDLGRKPVARDLLGRRLVAYRATEGKAVVLDARCSHLGADLGHGCVIGDRLQCPFHNWEYGADGRCVRIPAQDRIPTTARQTAYPVVERHGFVFFFSAPEALFPLPFFDACATHEFVPARPFATHLECPWFLIGANAFDLQHFRAAHDRRLAATPTVDCPGPFARRATATFTVSGDSWQDRFTRFFAGERVTMSITDWCGNLLLVTATFRRTRSYGMVVTEPTERGVHVRVIVFVPRSSSLVGRLVKDWLHAALRRYFIKRFLASDAQRLDGTRYSPLGLIEADRDLAEYFRWLAIVAHGQPAPAEPEHLASWSVEDVKTATVRERGEPTAPLRSRL